MKNLITALFLLITGLHGKLTVVASTTDLSAIAAEIGGSRVSVTSIARGNQDPHYIEILPSFMLKTRRADLYLKVGMELDLWADDIISGSRNARLTVIDCSESIPALEVPVGRVDASMGDIHRYGNPHYWLDPENGIRVATTITRALKSLDPENSAEYDRNLNAFSNRVNESLSIWEGRFADLKGKQVVYYHNTWPYFNTRFGLEVAAFVEPVPGIMPTPAHTDHLIQLINRKALPVLAMEPYFSDKVPQFLSRRTGIRVVKLAPSVGALPGTESYLSMIEYNLKTLKQAFPDQ